MGRSFTIYIVQPVNQRKGPDLRAITDISIPDDVLDVSMDKRKRIGVVDNVLTEIVNRIAKSDERVTCRMKSQEVEEYLDVELWVALYEWEAEVMTSEEGHTDRDDCPMCHKAQKIDYLQRFLQNKWRLQGREQKFKRALQFRCAEMPEGSKLN